MAKYKPTNPAQGHFLPVLFHKQLQQGTFQFAINHLIDEDLNLSQLDARYQNDDTGAPAYDPRILLKVVLLAYSRGITS
ncbi:MAG: transposase, partial [Desulfobulbaceae bacterium]|nr:transposase [Desulfobulbaceae bacterium]